MATQATGAELCANELSGGLRAVSVAALMFAAGVAGGPAVNAQSMQQALTQAYRTNPQLDAARATLRATDEEVARANATYRPVVSGNATSSWTRTDTQPISPRAGELHPRNFGVTVAQPLFRGFRSLNQVRVAEANVRAGRETLRNVEQTVLLLAATAYMDVVRDQAIVRLSENNVNVLSNQLKATQDQFAVGEVTRTDVAQAEARRAGSRGRPRSWRAPTSRTAAPPTSGSSAARRAVSLEPAEPTRLMPKSLPEATAIASARKPVDRQRALSRAGRPLHDRADPRRVAADRLAQCLLYAGVRHQPHRRPVRCAHDQHDDDGADLLGRRYRGARSCGQAHACQPHPDRSSRSAPSSWRSSSAPGRAIRPPRRRGSRRRLRFGPTRPR